MHWQLQSLNNRSPNQVRQNHELPVIAESLSFADRTESDTHTMMLLIGMCMSFTKNPMNPMMAKPMAVAMAIF